MSQTRCCIGTDIAARQLRDRAINDKRRRKELFILPNDPVHSQGTANVVLPLICSSENRLFICKFSKVLEFTGFLLNQMSGVIAEPDLGERRRREDGQVAVFAPSHEPL
jgi:hypothetical protein